MNRSSKTPVERNPMKRSNDDNYSGNSNSKKAKFEQSTENKYTTKESERKDLLNLKKSVKEENTEERQRNNKKTKIIENHSKKSAEARIEECVTSNPQSNITSWKNESSEKKGFCILDKSNKRIITTTGSNNLDVLSEINETDKKCKSSESDANVKETKPHTSNVKSDVKEDNENSTKTKISKSPHKKSDELRKESTMKVSEDFLFDSFDSLPEFESNIENLLVAENMNIVENQSTKVDENISIMNDFNSNQLTLYRNLSELEQESIQALQEISMGDSRHNFRETKIENSTNQVAQSNSIKIDDTTTLVSVPSEETNFTNKIEKPFIVPQKTNSIKNSNISRNSEKIPAELPLPDSTTQNLGSLDGLEFSSELISAQKSLTEDNTESLTIELKSLADSSRLEQENCLENLKISIPDNSFKSNHSAEYRIEVNQNEINVFINRKKRKSRSKTKNVND